jgi:hypothetical protein
MERLLADIMFMNLSRIDTRHNEPIILSVVPNFVMPATLSFSRTRTFLSLSGSMTAVAVFRKPNAISPRFSIDLVLNFSLSWLRVLLPSMFLLGRPLYRLSCGTHSKINFGILSSGILLT